MTFLAVWATIAIMTGHDPSNAGFLVKMAFLASSFVSIWGIITFSIFGFRISRHQNLLYDTTFAISAKYAFIISVLISTAILIKKIT